MQYASEAGGLSARVVPVSFVGDAIDDRGRAAVHFARSHSASARTMRFDSVALAVTLDDERMSPEAAEERIASLGLTEMLAEATTLGFVELLLLCRIARASHVPLQVVYVEPLRYSRPGGGQVLGRREFELSDVVEQFSALPGSALMIRTDRPITTVFFVGYEGQRLLQALEQTEVKPSQSHVVFGVPAFRPGWEMDAFANNVDIMRERRVVSSPLFCGAHSPAGAFEVLRDIYATFPQGAGQRMLVVPIGTKPHGLGAALFACEHSDVGLLYDHPSRKAGRTDRTGAWHLFDIGE